MIQIKKLRKKYNIFEHHNNSSHMQQGESRIFDPEEYRQQYYKNPEGHTESNMQGSPKTWTHQAFSLIPECDSYLQIGCGPVLTFATNASRKCKQIYLSQFNTECFKSISQQLKSDSSQKSFWEPHYQSIGKLQDIDKADIRKRLKQRVISCLKCDLTKQNILVDTFYFKKVDVVLSSLCIQAVAKNIQEYRDIIRKLKNHIKKDGFIYLFGVLEQSFYMVKDQRLPCLKLTQNDVKSALQVNGFEVIKLNSWRHQKPPTQRCDFKGLFSILAKNTN